MRLSIIASASLALVAFFTTSAFAQERANTPDAPQAAAQSESLAPKPGLELGARVGFGLGLGSVAQDTKMSDQVGSQIPLIVDIGYRITPNIYVGGYGQLGYGIVTDDHCNVPGVSCSAQSYRIGANAHYHFLPDQSFDPWVGVGFGYEWLHKSASGGPDTAASTVSGFELVNLQLGGDYRLSRNASIGPFASFALGQYSTQSSTFNGQDMTNGKSSIDQTALHEWLTLGVRGTFDL